MGKKSLSCFFIHLLLDVYLKLACVLFHYIYFDSFMDFFLFFLLRVTFLFQKTLLLKKIHFGFFFVIIYNVHCFYNPGILESRNLPKFQNPFNDVPKLCFIQMLLFTYADIVSCELYAKKKNSLIKDNIQKMHCRIQSYFWHTVTYTYCVLE